MQSDPGKGEGWPEVLSGHLSMLILLFSHAYILGSVYFAKFSFIKTTIALACIALIIHLICRQGALPDVAGWWLLQWPYKLQGL